jgi:hypothetical protein
MISRGLTLLGVIVGVPLISVAVDTFAGQEVKTILEKENPVIENPLIVKPKKGCPSAVRFEPDPSFGKDGISDSVSFSVIPEIVIDKIGNLFALDSKEGRISVLNSQGRLLRSFGRLGAGPGEFGRPVALILIGDDRLSVYDGGYRRFNVFSKEGRLIRAISWPRKNRVISVAHGPAGGIYLATTGFPEERDLSFDLYNDHLALVRHIGKYLDPPENSNWDQPRLITRDLRNGNLVFGSSNVYELTILNKEGAPIRKIRKAWTPAKLPETEFLAKLGNGGSLPKESLRRIQENVRRGLVTFPAFWRIIEDTEGNLWVRTFEKAKDGGYVYDIFSPAGECFLRVGFAAGLAAFYQDTAYVLGENEEGFPIIRKFKLIWTR